MTEQLKSDDRGFTKHASPSSPEPLVPPRLLAAHDRITPTAPLRRQGDDISRRHVASSIMELTAVGRPSSCSSAVDTGTSRRRAFEAVLHELRPQDRLAFVHRLLKDSYGQLRYGLDVVVTTCHDNVEAVHARLREIEADLVAALGAGAPDWRFAARKDAGELAGGPYNESVRLVPHGIAIRAERAVGLVGPAPSNMAHALVLPWAASASLFLSASLLHMLASTKAPCQLVVEFVGRQFSPADRADIAELVHGLIDVPTRSVTVVGLREPMSPATKSQILATCSGLQDWLTHPAGVDLHVRIHAQGRIPRALLRLAGNEILGGRSFDVVEASAHESCASQYQLACYLPIGSEIPALLPDPSLAIEMGLATNMPSTSAPRSTDGALLGRALTRYGEVPVNLSDIDRDQSCYVLGRSGTGKSTYLASRIQQDIERGDGVIVLDPHGDLFEHLQRTIPERRKQDVVLLDFTDFDHCPGLNLLQRTGRYPDLERNFIIRAISQIFQRLYVQVPESMGPMFQLYMRSSVALAMEDPDGCATLADIPRLLSDDLYREYLLRNCRDRDLKAFWVDIAHRVGGDHELKNLAPWIINKFTEFTDNALVRHIVGQPHSTIDFRVALDERRIVLVNLSKGLIGDLDSQFLGMLLTSRLLAAALSRADVAPEARTPCHVYIDEFHNLTTLSSVEALLAESRKYGITLTIAHQNLAQIPDRTAQTIMANTGSFVLFRLGPHDADALAKHVAPHFDAEDLARLPDHHAVMQMKVSNAPCSPFLVRTETPTTPDNAVLADQKELVDTLNYDQIEGSAIGCSPV